MQRRIIVPMAGLAAFVVVIAWLASSGASARGRDGKTSDELHELVEELRMLSVELRHLSAAQSQAWLALAQLERQPAGESQAGLAAQPIPPASPNGSLRELVRGPTEETWAALEERLVELRSAIEAETRALLERAPSGGLESAREQFPETNQYAVDEFLALWQRSPDAAKKSVLLRTPASLIRTYGPPTEVWRSAKSGLFFSYVRDWGPTNEPAVQVAFRICDGMVVDAWTEPYEPHED